MRDKLKVLVIPSSYPDEKEPIKGIFFKEQVEALNEYVDIAVLNVDMSIRRYLKNKYFFNRNRIYEGNQIFTVQLKRFNFGRVTSDVHAQMYKKYILKGFKQILKKFGKPDVIHAHLSYPAGYGAMVLSKKYNIPFMVTEHASFFETKLMINYKKYTERVLTEADIYSAVSSFLKDKISKAGRKQCEIIPNFICVDKFNIEVDKDYWKYNDKFNLLNVSLMTDIKGIDYLLKALRKLVSDYELNNIHLHLIGDGPKRNEYERLARKLNVHEYCTFYGLLDNKEVAKYMNLCDALVISSKTETFGIVGIEAMAAGIPVVATLCGGPEDYVNEQNGILVEKEEISSLVDGIIKIIDNYNKFNSEDMRQYVKDNYSKEAVSKKLVSLYKGF